MGYDNNFNLSAFTPWGQWSFGYDARGGASVRELHCEGTCRPTRPARYSDNRKRAISSDAAGRLS